MSEEYLSFRKQLDIVLTHKDTNMLKHFLIEHGQWSENANTDIELAMWMMIAGSPNLTTLHDEAQGWLESHGHKDESDTIRRSRQRQAN